MTDIDQTKVFAVVGTPNMGYEIYMLSRMRLQDLVKQHPVVVATVAINGVDENTDKETLITTITTVSIFILGIICVILMFVLK